MPREREANARRAKLLCVECPTFSPNARRCPRCKLRERLRAKYGGVNAHALQRLNRQIEADQAVEAAQKKKQAPLSKDERAKMLMRRLAERKFKMEVGRKDAADAAHVAKIKNALVESGKGTH